MTKLNPIQINQYLDKLFTFVEGLPMGEKGKEYIKFKFLIDFLDTWQFDEEVRIVLREMFPLNLSSLS